MADKGKRHWKRILLRPLVWINLLFVIFLLLSYLSPYVNPYYSALLAFWGLAYPFILLVNIFFIVLWVILWKRYFLLSLIFITLGFNVLNKHFSWNTNSWDSDTENTIKVLSYNVQNLAKNNLHIQNKETRNDIFNFLLSEDPDIVCMQEFYYLGKDTLSFINNLRRSLSLKYIYKKNYYKWKHKIHALITMTSYPVVNSGYIQADKSRTIAIYTDILLRGDTVRVYNVHLESIRFQESDLRFVNELANQSGNNTDLTEGSRSVFRKIGRAFRMRSVQADLLSKHIQSCRIPVIVCGDFNDTPASYTYRTIGQNLEDAFIRSGKGYGNTYAGKLPPIRIDYILFDPRFRSADFNVHKVIDLSDHFAISSVLSRE